MEPPKQAPEVNMGKAEVVVEEINKAKERKEGETFLPLYVPGMDEPFSESTDLAEWEISFHDMVHKIKASQKLNSDTKREKLKMLKDANGEVIDKLDAPTKMKVMAAANSLEEV
jgi:hypothetical protein